MGLIASLVAYLDIFIKAVVHGAYPSGRSGSSGCCIGSIRLLSQNKVATAPPLLLLEPLPLILLLVMLLKLPQ